MTVHVPDEFETIQAGIDAAVEGDTVLVADGTYTGAGNRDLYLGGTPITVLSENGPEYAVIDCESSGRGVSFDQDKGLGSRFEGFTITDGTESNFDGGGIYCYYSSPVIENCKISNNSAKNGGGISCLYSGPVIKSCTVSGNSVSLDGAGIFSAYSSVSISDCVISENGIGTQNDGGGIYLDNSFSTLTNCLLTENDGLHGGGIYARESVIFSKNCTFSRNEVSGSSSTAVYLFGSELMAINCIFWKRSSEIVTNTSEARINYSDIEGGWLGGGEGNIDEDPLFMDPEAGDYSLQPGSPCLDAGDLYSRLDQDGSINAMGTTGGTGELPPGVIGGAMSGTLTIADSPYIVSEDIVVESGEVLTVEPGVSFELHNMSGVTVYGELYARGTADSLIKFTGFQWWDKGGGIRFIEGGGELSFSEVEQCFGMKGGGVSCHYSSPVIQHCIISGNSAFYGGGIYCHYSEPVITGCTIAENAADIDAGGVFFDYSDAGISDCTISNNTAHSFISTSTDTSHSGGVYCNYSSPTLMNCEVSGNIADYSSGFFLNYSNPALLDCTISANTAEYKTAGIECLYSDPILTNCRVTENIAGEDCGGMYCAYSTPVITNSEISRNSSYYYGAGFYCDSYSDPFISGSTISDNSATRTGGGIYCVNFSSPVFENCELSGNLTHDDGGGIYIFSESPITLSNCVISGNEAYDDGGGICIITGSLSLDNCIISSNYAGDSGGGIFSYNTGLTIINCTFSENASERGGGGFYGYNSPAVIINCILWNDSPQELYFPSGSPNIYYSDVQGGWSGEDNIEKDPLFISSSFHGLEYLLQPSSPCIDAGAPAIEDRLYEWHPLWPEWYPDGARSDMGAYGGPGNIGWIDWIE